MSNGPSIQANKGTTEGPNRKRGEEERRRRRRRPASPPPSLPPSLTLSKTDAVSKPPLLNATVNGVGEQAGSQDPG